VKFERFESQARDVFDESCLPGGVDEFLAKFEPRRHGREQAALDCRWSAGA